MRVDSEVIDDEYNQIPNGYQRDDACILERIQPFQETQRNNEEHEGGDPEVTVDEIGELIGMAIKPESNAGHEVANDNHV